MLESTAAPRYVITKRSSARSSRDASGQGRTSHVFCEDCSSFRENPLLSIGCYRLTGPDANVDPALVAERWHVRREHLNDGHFATAELALRHIHGGQGLNKSVRPETTQLLE